MYVYDGQVLGRGTVAVGSVKSSNSWTRGYRSSSAVCQACGLPADIRPHRPAASSNGQASVCLRDLPSCLCTIGRPVLGALWSFLLVVQILRTFALLFSVVDINWLVLFLSKVVYMWWKVESDADKSGQGGVHWYVMFTFVGGCQLLIL